MKKRSSIFDWKAVLGIAVGFFGVWLLINGQSANGANFGAGSMQFFGAIAVMLAAMLWATGSIYGLRAPVPKSSLQTAGMQMLSGGSVLIFGSLVAGEAPI